MENFFEVDTSASKLAVRLISGTAGGDDNSFAKITHKDVIVPATLSRKAVEELVEGLQEMLDSTEISLYRLSIKYRMRFNTPLEGSYFNLGATLENCWLGDAEFDALGRIQTLFTSAEIEEYVPAGHKYYGMLERVGATHV